MTEITIIDFVQTLEKNIVKGSMFSKYRMDSKVQIEGYEIDGYIVTEVPFDEGF